MEDLMGALVSLRLRLRLRRTARRRMLIALALAGALALCAHADDQPSDKDLVYRSVGDRDLLLDLYLPPSPAPDSGFPLIVSIHGGGWAGADRHSDLILRKLIQRGYALASIDYRLSGVAKFPAQIDDVRHAVRWLVEQAPKLRLDPNRIVATGISAGGHLALLLGLSQAPGDRTIKAVCSLYGPTDLAEMMPEDKRNDPKTVVASLLGGTVVEKAELAREASPLSYVRKDSVPILLYHGRMDALVPVAQSIALDARMRAAGAESTLIIFADKGHAFGLDDAALRDVAAFFDRALSR